MKRLVLDTSVVSALLRDGPPRRLLILGRLKQIVLLSSLPMLVELSDVPARPKFAAKIAASGMSVDEIVSLYAQLVTLVEPARVPRLAPDPDDDVVIGTAIAASADYLVTGDRTLLSVLEFESGRIVPVGEVLQMTGAE